ncbi:MAG: DUF1579 family protein [Phycisphaerales bacterium]
MTTSNRTLALGLALVAGLAFLVGQATRPMGVVSAAAPAAQPDDSTPGFSPDDMARMAAFGETNENHEHLSAMLGTWDGTMRWRPTPDADYLEFPGTAVREWVLDGRFVREVVTAEAPGGGAYEGLGYVGYNNFDHRYESIWMENMSTGVFSGHGVYDPETKVFTFFGDRRDPMTGRMITTWSEMDMSDPNRHTLKGWEYAADGTAYQSAEGVFTRRN